MPVREFLERDLVHRGRTQRPRQTRVMHDLAGARIDAMMRVPKSIGDEMGAGSQVGVGNRFDQQAPCHH